MDWNLLYPQGLKKALTFSYDDGQIHDRRLVETLNRYGMKGTFHLNSGTLSTRISFDTLDTEGFVTKNEIASLYKGHEIACHGVRHAWLTQLTKEQLLREIWEDRRALEQISGYPVCGMSYAFGVYCDEAIQVLKMTGIEYSRTVESTNKFTIPPDFLRWGPTCHHNDNVLDLAADFLYQSPYQKLSLFYVWGHSYEFDRDNNWDVIEEFCKRLAFNSEIWYTTNIEFVRYIRAVKSLVSDVDGSMIYNPSGLTVWVKAADSRILQISPGSMIYINK